MEIVISGRNVEVPDHFRTQATERLERLGRYDHKITRVCVELTHEPNPRRSKSCQCVQITGRGRGPVVRGEGCDGDFQSAFDTALARLEARLRRAHDRRRVHHRRKEPVSVGRALGGPDLVPVGAEPAVVPAPVGPPRIPAARRPVEDAGRDDVRLGDVLLRDEHTDEYLGVRGAGGDDGGADEDTEGLPGRIVRRKEHQAAPMAVDDALSRMELVGHDFFLFCDAATGRPSVVYRRRGYDYGVIALAEGMAVTPGTV